MLAIVAAFKEEVNDYLRRGGFRVAAREGSFRFYQSLARPGVVVAEGGIGRQRAEEATRLSIERYGPEVIVSAGFAGGGRPGLNVGDVFLCDRLMSIDGQEASWEDEEPRERRPGDADLLDRLTNRGKHDRPDYTVCGCMSVPQLVSSGSRKSWIGSTFPVSIVDMESYWVSETAAAHGVPHVVVRALLDPMEQTLPDFVGKAVGEDGGPRWLRAARYLVTSATRRVCAASRGIEYTASGAPALTASRNRATLCSQGSTSTSASSAAPVWCR